MTSNQTQMTRPKATTWSLRFVPIGMSLFAVWLGLSCATQTHEVQASLDGEPRGDPAFAAEVVALAQGLIRTSMEGRQAPKNDEASLPSESRVIEMIEARLLSANIQTETAEYAPDQKNLWARLPATAGESGSPLLLYSHSDVAAIDEARWTVPSGETSGTVLYGRGALDSLSVAAVHTETLVELASLHGSRERPIWLLVVGDAEGTGRGIRAALNDWPDLRDAGFVLGGGGFLLENFTGSGGQYQTVAFASPGQLQFTIRAESGPTTRGRPIDNPLERIVSAAGRVRQMSFSPRWTSTSTQTLNDFASAQPLWMLPLYYPPAAEFLYDERLADNPLLAPLRTPRCTLNELVGEKSKGLVATSATAEMTCVVPDGFELTVFRDDVLRAIGDPKVTFAEDRLTGAVSSPPRDTEIIPSIEKEVTAGATLVRTVGGEHLDLEYFHKFDIPAYGYMPIRVGLDEWSSIHGPDERVDTDELRKGYARFVRVVKRIVRHRSALSK